jgi:hypothetical protein
MALAVVLEEQPVVTDAKGEQQGFVNSVFEASEEQHDAYLILLCL